MNKTNSIQRNKVSGFTLIEIMVVVVLIGILTSIAVPSYRSYMMKSNRTDAKVSLLKIAAAQEKNYLQFNTYTTDLGALDMTTLANNGHYTMSVVDADTSEFNALATAREGQAEDTKCLVFSINELGQTFGGANANKDDFDPECWGNL